MTQHDVKFWTLCYCICNGHEHAVLCTILKHVIEFQKWALPHAHLLIILERGHKITTIEDIDHVVSAGLPDPSTQRTLFDQVACYNLHGPCSLANLNAPCMKEGKCTKNFQKEFCPEVYLTESSCPIYKWPDNNRHHIHSRQQFCFDNRWI